MALPTVQEVRDELEGYCITPSLVGDAWISRKMTRVVIPYVEEFTRTNLSAEQEVTEIYSGNGQGLLILNRRNVSSVTNIRLVSGGDIFATVNLASVLLMPKEGMLKVKSALSEYFTYRTFPKGKDNIEVTYKYGGTCPDDIAEAIVMLTAIHVLDNLEGRSGGGQVSGQGYSRNYGNMGKYSNVRKRLSSHADTILRRYSTSVVGA